MCLPTTTSCSLFPIIHHYEDGLAYLIVGINIYRLKLVDEIHVVHVDFFLFKEILITTVLVLRRHVDIDFVVCAFLYCF